MDNIRKLAEEYGVTFVEVVDGDMLDPGLIAALPVTWAREQGVLPVRIDGVASLLMSGPEGMAALQHAALVAGEDLQPAFAARDILAAAVERAYYEGKSTSAPTPAANPATAPDRAESTVRAENDLLIDREAQPVTQFLNNVLLDAVRHDASDVHFDPTPEGPLRVRFRLDGVLHQQLSPPADYAAPIVSRIKVMAGMDIAERRLPQDGMAQVRVGGKVVDIRVSTVPVADGERVVMRLLNRDRSLLPMTSLGMPERVLASLHELLALPNGMAIVSGPTGSGKTTTLYAALGTLDAQRRNIMTIEEPVEYRLPSIGQIQVKPKIGLTFANGLRHILRQDPDVVLVGETRDAETAEIAVRASLTGHLVFTTLHTNDAPSAVMRLVDMGIEPYLLASCLRGVLAQRLVRRLCPHCATATTADDPTLVSAEAAAAKAAGCTTIRRAVGCSRCLEGYAGRIGIFEFMPCGPAIVEAIHRGDLAADELRAIAERDPAYHAMRTDAADKLRTGTTTPAEIVAAMGAIWS
ncbi:MAG: GspE/PulE family protein [Kiritimatiellia bacterium]|jgi:general secretion pathway protein E